MEQAILWTMFLCLVFAGVASLACSVALGIEAWRIQNERKAVRYEISDRI